MAVTTDGTLWAWGSNGAGQLGDGTWTGRSSPVQIGTAPNWAAVEAGNADTVAIKTDGTLWAWGDNEFGLVGDGTWTGRSSPVQVGTAANWAAVAAGGWHTVAVKTDGTLWAWGDNSAGQLGDGTTIHQGSPVHVGLGHWWVRVSTGNGYTMAVAASSSAACTFVVSGEGPNTSLGRSTRRTPYAATRIVRRLARWALIVIVEPQQRCPATFSSRSTVRATVSATVWATPQAEGRPYGRLECVHSPFHRVGTNRRHPEQPTGARAAGERPDRSSRSSVRSTSS